MVLMELTTDNFFLSVHICCTLSALLSFFLLCGLQAEDFYVLVRSCFSVLWNGLSAAKDKKILTPRDKLHCQMKALSFLLLLDTEGAVPPKSKTPIYTEDAITEFESSCGAVTKEDAAFLMEEMQTVFNRCWTGGQGCEEGRSKSAESLSLYALSEMALVIVKVLCKAAHYGLAATFVDGFESKVKACTAVVLGKWVVKIHSAMRTGGESSQALTECARALRSLPSDLGERGAHSVLEGCRLVMWAVESGHSKELSGPELLALFSFFEEHQEQILKSLKKASVACE